jgi:hypothetical protein
VIEWERQGTDNVTPTPALIEFTFTPTGDETSVEVQLSGLSAEDAEFYPQLFARYLDRINAAFLAPNLAHFLATESGTSPPTPTYGYARSTPCDGPATESS